MSRRVLLAVVLAGVLALVGVAGWVVTHRGTGVSTMSGTVVQFDRAANTLTIAPTPAAPGHANCHRHSAQRSPSVGCPPGLPQAADITVHLAASSRIRQCIAAKCSRGSIADLRHGQQVAVVATRSANGMTAREVSIRH